MLLPKSEQVPPPRECIKATPIRYREPGPQNLANCFGKIFNPILQKVRFVRCANAPLPQGLPPREEIIVLVSTTSPLKLLLAWRLAKKGGYQVIPYFMDDWLAKKKLSWPGGGLRQVAAELLECAPVRLMISKQLQQVLEARYNLRPAPTLVVHNPCPPVIPSGSVESRANTPNESLQNGPLSRDIPLPASGPALSFGETDKTPKQLIYAGSIWPMHADALIATAKAIHFLNSTNEIRLTLTIYTSNVHWNKYRSKMEGPGVNWGGWLPYEEVLLQLSKASMLMCAASFLPSNSHLTKSSVQTKLTDYLSVGRPILYVGPDFGASGIFVNENQCGFCINTPQIEDITNALSKVYMDQVQLEMWAREAKSLAEKKFSKDIVQKKLFDFLKVKS